MNCYNIIVVIFRRFYNLKYFINFGEFDDRIY